MIQQPSIASAALCKIFRGGSPNAIVFGFAVKHIQEIRRANRFIQNHADPYRPVRHESGGANGLDTAHQTTGDDGEAAVDVVPSAMHALSRQSPPASRDAQQRSPHGPSCTVKEIAARAVLFTRAFEKGYVDRLTSSLQRYSARRQDGTLLSILDQRCHLAERYLKTGSA